MFCSIVVLLSTTIGFYKQFVDGHLSEVGVFGLCLIAVPVSYFFFLNT